MKADLCTTPSLMQRIKDRAAKFKVDDVSRTWLLIPDYMMDRLPETDKENDIATACQENQERGVVGVMVG